MSDGARGPEPGEVRRWNRWARRYGRGRLQRMFLDRVHAAVLDTLGAAAGERVVDVGAGTGTVVAALVERGTRAVGVDPAAAMLVEARGRAGARFACAAAEALPFADGCADVVTTSLSLHHWHDQDRGLDEMVRVLAPGGRVVLADVERRGAIAVWEALTRLARPGGHHPHYLTRAEAAEAFRTRGLLVVEQRDARRRVALVVARKAPAGAAQAG